MIWIITIIIVIACLALLAVYDLTQKRHAILRNFPIIGHFRYLFESVGPELRQYIVTNNDEERPFSRDQRRWVYASAKRQNNYFGFGTDNELEQSPNYLIIKHDAFPMPDLLPGVDGYDPGYPAPCAKILGGARQRARAFRPESIVNVSGMSFGSLSAPAVESINRGVKLAGCLQNTGEGGVSPHHGHGGGLVWQLGTGYFGCRNADGTFDIERFADVIAEYDVRAVEIKLSQGAKPGIGGVLPAVKLTHELAEIRGVPYGQDCISPSTHSAFSDTDSMLDFVEMLAERTGVPIGIKSAVGQMSIWDSLVEHMASNTRGVDFIAIDGGEGGTGAAPLVFSDHVAMPFKLGFGRVFRRFAEAGIDQNVVFVGAGRLGLPESALFAFALGCDAVGVAREAMLAIGCIQAQRCHTNHCPTGVATQSKWLMRGLDPTSKAARLANYIVTLRKEILRVCRACGVPHPALLNSDHLEIVTDRFRTSSFKKMFDYKAGWGLPSAEDQQAIRAIMTRSDD